MYGCILGNIVEFPCNYDLQIPTSYLARNSIQTNLYKMNGTGIEIQKALSQKGYEVKSS